MFEREMVTTIKERLQEPRHFMQIVIGPRQTGKSTAVNQALEYINVPKLVFSFDRPRDQTSRRLEEIWNEARALLDQNEEAILSLDEIQKITNWSSTVKFLWDDDTRNNRNLKVILTGSSALNLKAGMSESLKGRFEEIVSTHWTLAECSQAFGYSLDQFLFYGGYPGASVFIDDIDRWFAYMHDSIIEPTISQDVLEMEQVRKPALLRALFEIGALYSAQEISYRKLLGQLDDRGNTDTISHYLTLLAHAGLLSGLKKYNEKPIKSKTSSPRLMVHDTSLMTAASEVNFEALMANPAQRGHLVESAVGAYLIGRSRKERFNVYWWRERDTEADFVITKGRKRTAIEVKSERIKGLKGLGEFVKRFPESYSLLVGTDTCSLEDFLLGNVPLFQ